MVAMAPQFPKTDTPARTQRYIGRYELIGELARGGMGTVYLARHAGEAGFQRLFAIKVMHPHLAEEKEFVDMLRDEARIAARIHHPNVVAIVDIGVQDDLHYVVMDYVEGPPFGTLIKRSSSENVLERIITITIDTLEGIHAAHTLTDDEGHALNLVHRDVSPQNILVGVDGVARITDFGIAKAETRISSTRPGTRKGKLAFMAPEQITNEDAIDRRADIWAAGVVLWTGLTGRNLFRGESDAATIHAVLSKEILPPSQVGRRPPEFLDAVVMRALERDPEKRYASALEMADALRFATAQNGLKSSRQDVAQWVSALFGEELTLRRQAIRAVARRREEQQESTEASQITVLPALPGVGGSMSGGGTMPGNTSISLGDGRPSPQPSLAATAVPSAAPMSNPFAAHKRRRALAAVSVVLFGLLAIALYILLSSKPAEPIAEAAAPPAPPKLPAAEAQRPEPVVKAAEPAVNAPAKPAEGAAPSSAETSKDGADAKVADNKPESRKAVRYGARRIYARPVVKTAPAAAEPAEEPKADPKPLPASASSPGFEKNPYLRR